MAKELLSECPTSFIDEVISVLTINDTNYL